MRNTKPPPQHNVPPLASKSTTRATVVLHEPGDRGPRHARYPEINVSATARIHNISTSQLSRLLNGDNCPSIKSLWLLSAILGKTVEEVAEMYKTKRVKKPKPTKEELKKCRKHRS